MCIITYRVFYLSEVKEMKWMLSLVLGTLILFSTTAYSQQGADKFVVPKQTIVGADEPVPPGDVVILKISPIEAKDRPQYLKEVQYRWTVFKNGKKFERFLPWPDGSVLAFGSGVDTKVDIKVILTIAYRYEVQEDMKDKDGKVVGKVIKESAIRLVNPLVAQVKIGNGPDIPDPVDPVDPIDPIVPDPTFPFGKYGLSKVTYDASKSVKLDASSKQKSAQALASNYRGLASAVSAGTIKTAKDLLEKTAAGNEAAFKRVNVAKNEWQAWDDSVEAVLVKLNKTDKTLVTLQDFVTAWNEIATGLDAVK